jgi:hypothetical protein
MILRNKLECFFFVNPFHPSLLIFGSIIDKKSFTTWTPVLLLSLSLVECYKTFYARDLRTFALS